MDRYTELLTANADRDLTPEEHGEMAILSAQRDAQQACDRGHCVHSNHRIQAISLALYQMADSLKECEGDVSRDQYHALDVYAGTMRYVATQLKYAASNYHSHKAMVEALYRDGVWKGNTE